MAAHGRGACGFGHRDMDRGRATQAFWNIQRVVAGARFASCNFWHSAFAGVWGLLGTPRKLEGRPHIRDRDSYRGTHGARSVVVRVFHLNRADVLPIGVAQQGSGGDGAQAGDCAMSTLRTAELTLASRVASRASAYVALTKPDVSFLVLITTAAGFYMGSRGPVDWLHMVHTVFGTMLIAAGTAALNHYIERDSDRLMRRTASRPLPSGVLKPRQALVYGIALSIAGALYLYFAAGTLAAGLGVITCLGYLLAYTPLKKRTVWATFVGAFPGAIPPMIGWVAATGRLMLPVVDPEGSRTFRQILVTAAALVGISLLPAIAGLTGVFYFFGALGLSVALLQVCVWAASAKTNNRAKWLMHATVAYIPF